MPPKSHLAIVLLSASLPLFGQDVAVFSTEARLSTVNLHVVQGKNYVETLKPEDFVLLEDGAPKPITVFESAATQRTAPMEMILLFDKSGSVTEAGLLNPMVFRDQLLVGLPNVKLSVYGFGTRLARYASATRDFTELAAAFSALAKPKLSGGDKMPLVLFPKRLSGNGETWLYEAIAATVKDVSGKEDGVNRMILVFSDGLGTTNAAPEDAARICQEAGIPVYPILLGHRQLRETFEQAEAESSRAAFSSEADSTAGGLRASGTAAYRLSVAEGNLHAAEAFAGLGDLTGGSDFDPPQMNLEVMRNILESMVFFARTEYVVGFAPAASEGKPRQHKIEVRLRDPKSGKVLGGSRTAAY